jgi:hypothetical protein
MLHSRAESQQSNARLRKTVQQCPALKRQDMAHPRRHDARPAFPSMGFLFTAIPMGWTRKAFLVRRCDVQGGAVALGDKGQDLTA